MINDYVFGGKEVLRKDCDENVLLPLELKVLNLTNEWNG